MIIRRFPQLSYDWIFVGSGKMLSEGEHMMRSVHDHELTVQARFVQSMERIEKIEYSINELANRIDRSLTHQAEMTNIFFSKIDMLVDQDKYLTNTAKEAIEEIQKMYDLVEKTFPSQKP